MKLQFKIIFSIVSFLLTTMSFAQDFSKLTENERLDKVKQIEINVENYISSKINSYKFSNEEYDLLKIGFEKAKWTDNTDLNTFELAEKRKQLTYEYFNKNQFEKEFINSLNLYYTPPPQIYFQCEKRNEVQNENLNFGRILLATCDSSIVPPGSLNGNYISESYTGSVELYLPAFSSCSPSVNTPPNSKYLGSNGAFSYTMLFSEPINELTIALTAAGYTNNENFIFTTNTGIPSITAIQSCFSTINGNEILSGAGTTPSNSNYGGGGIFKISRPTPFTSITISGNGGEAGSLLSVCSSSILPCQVVAAPILTGSFINNGTTVNLTPMSASNLPAIPGISLTWHTATPPTSANKITDITALQSGGTYYAAFYDQTINGCYSDTLLYIPSNAGCLPANCAIYVKDKDFCAGKAILFEVLPTPSNTELQYNWVFYFDNNNPFLSGGYFPLFTSTLSNPSFTPNYTGNYHVVLTVTGSNGCNEVLTYDFEVTKRCFPIPCTLESENANYVKQRFINLVNEIRGRIVTGLPVDNNYAMTSIAFQQLKPFITDENPGIYNFAFSGGPEDNIWFSFSDHSTSNEWADLYVNSDVYIHEGFLSLGNVVDFDLNNYTSPEYFFGGDFDSNSMALEQGNTKSYTIRHINFCPDKIPCTASNNLSPLVENLFQELIRDLIDKKVNQGLLDADINSNNSVAMIALAPYCTDPDAKVWNFSSFTDNQGSLKQMIFSFSKDHTGDVVIGAEFDLAELLNIDFHVDLSSFVDTDVSIDFSGDYSAIYPESKEKIIFRRFLVKHIDFCPKKNYTTSCTKENSLSAEVDLAFKNFLSFVINKKLGGWADLDFETNQINELDILAEFITDEDPGIFNFQSTYNGNTLNKISFSFDPDHIMDVTISGNLEDYVSFLPGLDLMSNYYHPNIYTLYSEPKFELKFRHINYCPTKEVDIKCLHHIAIVVDESGSLSTLAKTKIKRQLRKFIEQQKLFNDTPTPGNANIYVSLIRMSDSDTGIRTDHVIEKRVDNSTINEFETWLNNYGVYTTPSNGKSQGSDFWKSGLDRATDPSMVTKPDVVIMITDGCQTADPVALKQTMSKFSNYMPVDNTKPHLYVIGIENGFYVYDENAPGALPREQDPNYVTFDEDTTRELHRKEQGEDTAKSENEVSMPLGRLTSSLRLSLKFLLNHSGDSFPVASIDDFTMDYYGHDDFRLIGEDLTYIADNITSSTVPPRVRFLPEECGNIVPKDPCDSCFSFQPEPGKTYVVNAWVKEELNIQVTNYSNPKVRLAFFNNGAKDTPLDINLPNSSIIPPALNDDYIEFSTIGDIIDGWQRISGKFTIPTDSDFVDFKLVNKSQNFPVYFDDVRIYPVDGSMKSFVYDPVTFKLMSELDENNYATFYEYDKEGGLVRVKKETSRGVKTIQETRSGNYIKE